MIEIPAKYYSNGYKVSELNCVALSAAHCAGVFDDQLYYDYCCIYCLNQAFNLFESSGSNIDSYKNIMDMTGLEMSGVLQDHPPRSTDIREYLEYYLSNNIPLFLYTNYECLFYSDGYREPKRRDHAIIVLGYDRNKDIVIVQDLEAIDFNHIQYTKGQIYYKLRLKGVYFDNIVEELMAFYNMDYNQILHEKLLYVRPKNTGMDINSIIRANRNFILEKVVNSFEKEFRLFGIYSRYKELKDPEKIRLFFSYSRRSYHASFNVISEYIQANCNLNDQQNMHVQKLVKTLQDSIDKYISVSHKEHIARVAYDVEKYSKLQESVKADMSKLIYFTKPFITSARHTPF